MKKKKFRSLISGILLSSSLTVLAAVDVYSQTPTSTLPEDNTWWYVTLFILVLGLVGLIGFWYNSKKAQKAEAEKNKFAKKTANPVENYSLDSYREMEWLRTKRNSISRKKKPNKNFPENLPHPSRVLGEDAGENDAEAVQNDPKFVPPVFNIQRIELARPFAPLPISADEALLSAIEQAQDEYEEDEEVRDLAVRILAAFKTQNSIEALSQMALYDLSSSLRSKAVSILADFDHESVFEIILLATADPSREVRAAAARGLSRLSFDRADAWLRIAESGDAGRMRQAAHAAIEGGFVERIFDRLIHRDQKYAFEAVALLSLLIKAGATEPIFQRFGDDKNPLLQRAILHVIKITKSENAMDGLYAMLERKEMSAEMKREIDETIQTIGLVPA